jgi:CBS domain-containing protein
MTRDVASVAIDTPLSGLVEIMRSRHVKRLPVVQDDKLVGIVSRADLLKAVARLATKPTATSDAQIRKAVLAALQGPRELTNFAAALRSCFAR